MQRRHLIQIAIALGLDAVALPGNVISVRAQDSTVTAGEVQPVTTTLLGAIAPIAAPGSQLILIRREWLPGSSSTSQSPSGALVSYVATGEVTIELLSGAAQIWRAHEGESTPSAEVVPRDAPIVCRPGDCVTSGQDPIPMVYRAWNTGGDPAVVWEAHLSLDPLARHWPCK